MIYRPSFDIIDVFRFFMAKPLKTFEKVSLKKNDSEQILNILSSYTDMYLGVDILGEDNEMEV